YDDAMSQSASPAKRPQRRPKPQIKSSCWVPNALFQHCGQARLDTTSKLREDECIASGSPTWTNGCLAAHSHDSDAWEPRIAVGMTVAPWERVSTRTASSTRSSAPRAKVTACG